MARYLPLLLITLLAISASSCLSDGPAAAGQTGPQLFAELFIRYIEPQGQLKATASFLKGDSLATAQPTGLQGGLRLQGQLMPPRYLPNNVVRYQRIAKQPYDTTYTFSFTGLSGAPLSVPLQMPTPGSFRIKEGKASLTDGFTLQVDNGQLSEQESLVLLFSDAQSRASTITLTGPLNKNEFAIAGARLHRLRPGPHTLYLVRKKRSLARADGLTVAADLEFYTRTIPLEVVE